MATGKNPPRPSGAHPGGARHEPGTHDGGGCTAANLYATHFTDDELSRIIAELADPAARLDSAVEATYVLLDRIIGRMSAGASAGGMGEADPDTFVKLVRAHNDTTGRIAALLRSRQVIHGEGADTLTGHIASALDQLAEQLQAEL